MLIYNLSSVVCQPLLQIMNVKKSLITSTPLIIDEKSVAVAPNERRTI